MEELKVEIDFLSRITGMDSPFFERYKKQEQKSFTMNEIRLIKES